MIVNRRNETLLLLLFSANMLLLRNGFVMFYISACCFQLAYIFRMSDKCRLILFRITFFFFFFFTDVGNPTGFFFFFFHIQTHILRYDSRQGH